MADESQAAAAQKDPYAVSGQHSSRVIDSLMPESIEKVVVQISLAAVDRSKHLKDVAQFVKHEMDKNFPNSGKATEGVYQCIVGKSFASAISHECRQFIHMKVDTYHILLWKSKDTPFHTASA
eukprot:GHRR01023761.1.p1 GENE.GHRR01023761.1~~GHRR01023761.1.p1  ORF type:complete len:123 (+),score=19.28 GHRR01023761.1:363-731(+)